jgi:hypothetical protein
MIRNRDIPPGYCVSSTSLGASGVGVELLGSSEREPRAEETWGASCAFSASMLDCWFMSGKDASWEE